MSEWITKAEAAQRLGVSIRTIDRLLVQHGIPKFKQPGHRALVVKASEISRLAHPRRVNNGN